MPLKTVWPQRNVHALSLIGTFIVGMCVNEQLRIRLRTHDEPSANAKRGSKNSRSSVEQRVIHGRKNLAHLFRQADALFQDIKNDAHTRLLCKTAQCLHAKRIPFRRHKSLATIYSSYILQKNLT